MAVPLIAGGIMTAGRAGLSYWAKKKLQREAAARLALETSKATAVPALTSGSTGLYAKNLAKYTAAGVGGVGVGNSIEAMTQQPNGGDLHPRVEAMERLRNGGGMTGLEKGVPEEIHGDAYVSQDERDMINHFSRIDSMNLSQKAREMLKEDYLRNRTGAAKTVQEVGDTYPDVEFQESVAEEDNLKTKLKKYGPFLLDPTGFNRKLHGGTYNAIKTWMGMPRDK